MLRIHPYKAFAESNGNDGDFQALNQAHIELVTLLEGLDQDFVHHAHGDLSGRVLRLTELEGALRDRMQALSDGPVRSAMLLHPDLWALLQGGESSVEEDPVSGREGVWERCRQWREWLLDPRFIQLLMDQDEDALFAYVARETRAQQSLGAPELDDLITPIQVLMKLRTRLDELSDGHPVFTKSRSREDLQRWLAVTVERFVPPLEAYLMDAVRSKQTGLVNAYFHYSAGWICDWKGPLLCRLMTEAGLCLLDTQSISGGVSVIRGLAASLPLSVQKLVPVPIPVPAKDFAKAHTVARGASLDKAHAWTGCPLRLVHSNDKDLRWNLADGFVPGVGMRHAGVGTPLTLVQNGRDLYLAYSVVNRPNAAALLEVLRGTSQLRSEDWILILLQLLVILVEEDQPASVVSLRQTLREKTEVMEGIQSGTDNPKLRCLLEAIGKELSGELEQGPLAFLADRERCETWGIDGLLYDAGC